MSRNRCDTLKRMASLAWRIEGHIQKMMSKPDDLSLAHWRAEVENWVKQIANMLPHVGERTGEEWQQRVAEWTKRLRPTQ